MIDWGGAWVGGWMGFGPGAPQPLSGFSLDTAGQVIPGRDDPRQAAASRSAPRQRTSLRIRGHQ